MRRVFAEGFSIKGEQVLRIAVPPVGFNKRLDAVDGLSVPCIEPGPNSGNHAISITVLHPGAIRFTMVVGAVAVVGNLGLWLDQPLTSFSLGSDEGIP